MGARDNLSGITTYAWPPQSSSDDGKTAIVNNHALFPQVALAVKEGRELLPRYFLNLPEEASRESIEKAYQRAVKRWQPLTKSSKECMRELGMNMLHVLRQAYLSLIGEENTFVVEVYTESSHYLPWVEVAYDEWDAEQIDFETLYEPVATEPNGFE